ncbi:hypothetical protein Dsin_004057 [Dipteronia sinensis]|uniref:DC1 domain-containing protein n=1 Tax=Dipteronia sinensis TaxID=43782 RepID=A0AAE0EKX5_9ROSI|nr:hypothetical protein Dsin_004057 [Dipteronia sinensis]
MEETHPSHKNHKLKLHSSNRLYRCDGCMVIGVGARYRCDTCDLIFAGSACSMSQSPTTTSTKTAPSNSSINHSVENGGVKADTVMGVGNL